MTTYTVDSVLDWARATCVLNITTRPGTDAMAWCIEAWNVPLSPTVTRPWLRAYGSTLTNAVQHLLVQLMKESRYDRQEKATLHAALRALSPADGKPGRPARVRRRITAPQWH